MSRLRSKLTLNLYSDVPEEVREKFEKEYRNDWRNNSMLHFEVVAPDDTDYSEEYRELSNWVIDQGAKIGQDILLLISY